MKKSLLVFASALVLFATSCKKDDDAPAVTVQSLSGTYKLSKITVKVGNSTEEDRTNDFVDDCEKDDLTTLNSDMTYNYVDAGESCGWGNDNGTWSLTNTTTIVFDGETSTIRKFDGKNLELAETMTYNGVSATIITYYVKQ